MGRKNKTKKGKGAEKTLKKTQHKLEKKLAKVEKESGEQSIEQLIEEFQQEQKKITEVTISPCSPPSPRSHFTLTASPESDELVLFGGEYYDGKKTTMFSDLFVYHCKDNRWEVIKSSNTPPPRSGHQAVYIKTSNTPASVWVFGGEYASPTQLRFYHYKDLWCLRLRTRKWEHMRVEGSCPCARSGHRMVAWKSSFMLFGGFSDTGSKTVYFNDMWIFDLDVLRWNPVQLTGDVPSPRSGCLFFPGSDMKYLYIFGGYFKEYVTRDMERGVACADFFRVNIEKDASVAKCICMRTSGIRPKPPRSAMAGVLQTANRVILFGGVHDIESEDGESVVGHFHNDMYVVDLEKAKWHLFNYTTGKQLVKSNPPVVSTHNDSDSMKLTVFTSNPPIDGASGSLLSDGVFTLTLQGSTEAATRDKSAITTQNGDGNLARTIPSPRSSPGVVILGSTLYVYGGFYEVGDRKITLDDLYCLDLSQPISWQCLFNGSQAEQSPSTPERCPVPALWAPTLVKILCLQTSELVDDAPAPVPSETQNGYWNRTMLFWCSLVRQGLGEDETKSPTTSQVPYDPAVLSLAKRLAKDFYDNNSHTKT
ncbi:Kelch domain-containing protein 4 [Paragonimus heterotremus]|uniref:Kelch domain-containing protein 4 n=1 Tax=Paragonimus heterotremus TaxID=100268 RepID=A0A8J4SKQ7_9TREM|nr:Kelch domain-containing protein 4 [Paragonimus heterotremus]